MEALPRVTERTLVELPDEEELTVDWFVSLDQNRWGGPGPQPTIILLHGITGGSHSMVSMIREAMARGWCAVVVNRRGHGNPLKVCLA